MNSRTYLLMLAVSFTGMQEARAAQAAGDAAVGQVLYQAKCAACHAMQFNGVGPAHLGVVGRKAGSVDGYIYSVALSKSDLVWNEKLLDAWLRNPEKLVPGQKMGISIPSARERAHLIAYLKTLKVDR
ncbi:c-type cytochrome [Undibacterium sp. CY18W]|uniref:C-type cytochrome n=1 Tax=Undibacterium hunanense TaxID=2762292 RepID=A0ABR6ZXQ1_9BURK|nr:c-type cytochrome [Undibacterium hunanense]MBC3920657.1 c-type cytochrome [Undibacterium hunanense]